MNRNRPTPPPRIDIWRSAAWYALIAATVALLVVKLFTGIVLMTAFLFAVIIFMIAFGFAIRLSPRRYQ